MPVSEEILAEPRNNFIAVSDAATVGQAIEALLAHGGQAWWHLIVQQQPGSFGYASFAQLYQAFKDMPEAAYLRLAEWGGLVAAGTVDGEAVSTAQVQQLARQNPARLIVVTRDNLPVGVVFEGATRSGAQQPVSASQLNTLAGPYVNLNDYAAILLSASKKPKS
jgi:hypothetical protein